MSIIPRPTLLLAALLMGCYGDKRCGVVESAYCPNNYCRIVLVGGERGNTSMPVIKGDEVCLWPGGLWGPK